MNDRRKLVSFDPDYFARRSEAGSPLGPLAAFRHAHENNLWRGPETESGPGSSHAQTRAIREALPGLCATYDVHSLLDVPCGSFHWMSRVKLPGVRYRGGDLVPEVVETARRHGSPGHDFDILDLTSSELPPADLLLCRDLLVHLSFTDIASALRNVRASAIRYLLTTTFTREQVNGDIVTGDWRPLNLELAPFGFPPPLDLVDERCSEQEGAFADKSLGLWRVSDLPDP